MTPISLQSLSLRQEVLLVPTHEHVPAGKGKPPFPKGGARVRLSEYHFELVRRGSARCFAIPPPVAVPESVPAEPPLAPDSQPLLEVES